MASASAVAKVNQRALEDYLATNDATKALAEVALTIVDEAVTEAPEKTGYYKRRMQARKFRNWWRVENVDPFAHLVEWGSVNNRAYAPIRRAIQNLDVKFKAGPKG